MRPFSAVFPKGLPGWKNVAQQPEPFLKLDLVSEKWLATSLEVLLENEALGQQQGNSVCHFDLRSDNICFGKEGVKIIDWNFACIGNADLDLGFMLPSLRLEGGPLPETVRPHAGPISAVVSGFFAALAGLPADDDSENRVRNIQKAQLLEALPWAVRTLGLSEVGLSI